MANLNDSISPEHTAIRVALWRALHLEVDDRPAVFEDDLGRILVSEENWRSRGDMDPEFSRPMRAGIVARSRFTEDLVFSHVEKGVDQYLILGSGLDTFALRNPEISNRIKVFEIDRPGPLKWKQNRLLELGINSPKGLYFVPVDFGLNENWLERLEEFGFDKSKPSIVVANGLSMYLSEESNKTLFYEIASFAPGSVFAMTFLLHPDLLDAEEESLLKFVMKKAKESGTPFLGLFAPKKILEMANAAGFKKTKIVSADDLFKKYLINRRDNLRAGKAENFLLAFT